MAAAFPSWAKGGRVFLSWAKGGRRYMGWKVVIFCFLEPYTFCRLCWGWGMLIAMLS